MDKSVQSSFERLGISEHGLDPREQRIRGVCNRCLSVLYLKSLHAEAKTGFFGAPSEKRRFELMQI